ncbi:uncharacterized protein LOC135216924 [Macrobrachium nipponense]|uniref:uncharacterized protein LOC135216924 n=1 Tax=Macrobrachium nipponense TaxID=159736 RepID=UPI0030C8C1D1
MRHGCWLACFSLLAMVAASFSAHVQPVSESDVGEIPERLRELLLVQRLISSLNPAEALPELQAQVQLSSSSSHYNLKKDLETLSKAAAADIDFRALRVSKRSIRSFCSGNASNRQCRSFCFNLGDSACADGDLGGNGEDSKFLSGGMTPGK